MDGRKMDRYKMDRRQFAQTATAGLAAASLGLATNNSFAQNNPTPHNLKPRGSVAKFKFLQSYPEAPNVAFQDENGRDRFLQEFKGRPLLVTFWSVNCHACEIDMPTLPSLQAAVSGTDAMLLPVSIDSSDATNRVRRYYRQRGLTGLPIYTDEKRLLFAFFNGFATPMHFIVDRAGHVAGGMAGAAGWNTPEAQSLFRHFV